MTDSLNTADALWDHSNYLAAHCFSLKTKLEMTPTAH